MGLQRVAQASGHRVNAALPGVFSALTVTAGEFVPRLPPSSPRGTAEPGIAVSRDALRAQSVAVCTF